MWNNMLGGMNVQMLQRGNFTSDPFCSLIVYAACTTPHTLLLLCRKHHIKAWFVWPEWHKQAAMMGIILTNTDPLKLHDITQTHTHPPLAPTYYNHWTHQRISQLALHCGGQGTYSMLTSLGVDKPYSEWWNAPNVFHAQWSKQGMQCWL